MKRQIKLIFCSILYYSGLFGLIRFAQRLSGRKLTVLTFHRVTTENTANYHQGLTTISISSANFSHLINFVRKHYTVISLGDYLRMVEKQETLPANSIILSFDDGYRDVLKNAVPVLQKQGLPAILFVPTAAIDAGQTFWWDALFALLQNGSAAGFNTTVSADPAVQPYLKRVENILNMENGTRQTEIFAFIDGLQTVNAEIRERVLHYLLKGQSRIHAQGDSFPQVLTWDEIRQCTISGFEIGSHTVTHQFLTSVPQSDAEYEIVKSKSKLELFLGSEVTSFSYPGGHHDGNTALLVEKAAYSCAFTSVEGLNSTNTNRFKLKRINVSDDNLITASGRFSPVIAAWSLFLRW